MRAFGHQVILSSCPVVPLDRNKLKYGFLSIFYPTSITRSFWQGKSDRDNQPVIRHQIPLLRSVLDKRCMGWIAVVGDVGGIDAGIVSQ